MRRSGKSIAAEAAKEFALNQGLRVLVCTPHSITLQRRKGHLTMIQDVRRMPKPEYEVIYDDH